MRVADRLWIAMLAACEGGGTVTIVDGEGDADADADSDADADADSDADSDADTDLGRFRDDQVLVVPHARGLSLYANDGSVAFSGSWTNLVGDCPTCGGEGATADGDGLLLAFTLADSFGPGGIARLGPDLALDWRLDGFDFPHDATRDPLDDTLIVTESTSQRMVWVPGDGSSATPVRALDDGHPDWTGGNPNGVDRFDHEGRSLLVSSHRGGGPGSPAAGEITMWDLTTATPELLWRFPAAGALDTPHGCLFRQWNGRWWLLYAHTEGAEIGGAVGLAVTDDPTVRPEYVADLLATPAVGAFGFLRGVELTDDGWLYLTDTRSGGPGAGPSGRVVRAAMPDLAPTGATGAVDQDQVFVDLVDPEAFVEDLDGAFEGWLWVPPAPL